MTTLTYDPELLKHDFESTAEWRQRKADEHPNDARNRDAAVLLGKLAATVDEIDPAILETYGELFEDAWDSEPHAELLRQIGFSSWPSTATEFVQGYIASRTGR